MDETVQFGKVLWEAGILSDVAEIWYYFERPEKWNTEKHLWKENGKPLGEGDKGWDEFVKAYDATVVSDDL